MKVTIFKIHNYCELYNVFRQLSFQNNTKHIFFVYELTNYIFKNDKKLEIVKKLKTVKNGTKYEKFSF